MNLIANGFFDRATRPVTYVVYQGAGTSCAIIDSALGYDPKSVRTSTAPADHLSAAQYLRKHLGCKIAIGDHITTIQSVFKDIFNLEPELKQDGSQFDHLLAEDEAFNVGELNGKVLFVAGHTPACVAYQFGDAVLVGDTMFMPDVGTAHCDFPGGNAHTLFASVRQILSLPKNTRLFMCHDYPPNDREVANVKIPLNML